MLSDFTYLSSDYASDWLARSAEIVSKYHPDIMYFDWWIGQPGLRNYLTKFASFYYNDSLKQGGRLGVINYKFNALDAPAAVLDIERGELSDLRSLPWQTDTSVSNKSWGYIQNDTFKTPAAIVHELVDIVSKNGNLLLNIGPRSDGTIPDEVQQVLRSVGSWLQVNGDAIYGTRPWIVAGEGPTRKVQGSFTDSTDANYTAQDFRFTVKNQTLYAIELGWPEQGEALIKSLGSNAATRITAVSLLGSGDKLTFHQDAAGLHIQVPAAAPGTYAYSYRIEIAR